MGTFPDGTEGRRERSERRGRVRRRRVARMARQARTRFRPFDRNAQVRIEPARSRMQPARRRRRLSTAGRARLGSIGFEPERIERTGSCEARTSLLTRRDRQVFERRLIPRRKCRVVLAPIEKTRIGLVRDRERVDAGWQRARRIGRRVLRDGFERGSWVLRKRLWFERREFLTDGSVELREGRRGIKRCVEGGQLLVETISRL